MQQCTSETHHRRAPTHKHAPKELLSLNLDVLTLVLNILSPADALRFAFTCRRAYHLAIPRAVSQVKLGGCTIVCGPEQVTQFCHFMLQDEAGRVPHLKALEIGKEAFLHTEQVDGRDTWLSDFSCASILATLLQKATNLRTLIIRDCEQLLASQPAVGDALASLPRLKSVYFHYFGRCTLEMLNRAACRPRQVELGMWRDEPQLVDYKRVLDKHRSSLEDLSLWQCESLLQSVGEECVSPHVRRLGLGGRVPHLAEIARAFPAVRDITFACECAVAEEAPAAHWSGLDRIKTGVPLPFFCCSVRRLELRYVLGKDLPRFTSREVGARTATLLGQTQPAVLSCMVMPYAEEGMLRKIAEAGVKLKYLEVVLDLRRVECNFEAWVTKHLGLFGSVPLVGVSICRQTRVPDELPEWVQLRLARTVAARIPTVKYVGIGFADICGKYRTEVQCAPVWFERAARPVALLGLPLLVQLSRERGEEVEEMLMDMPAAAHDRE